MVRSSGDRFGFLAVDLPDNFILKFLLDALFAKHVDILDKECDFLERVELSFHRLEIL